MNKWDYENGFYHTSHVTRLAKAIAHYELYKSIINLTGHVVECGVYKGASLVRFATFREILESPYSRKIVAFDAFGTFPTHSGIDDADALFIKRFEEAGGHGISLEELGEIFAYKAFKEYEFIAGDIIETIPKYVSDHPELKISLLHVDVDVYMPSVVILENMFDKVVPGGIVVLDDYGTVAGATRAIDEYIKGRGLIIEKLPISHIPAFIRKGGA